VTRWLEGLLSLTGPVAYLVVGGLVFAEDAIFVGFVLPGESAAVLGGVLAWRGTISLGLLLVVVILAAIVGDNVGYEVGRHFGDTLLGSRPLRRHRHRLDRVRGFLRERGGIAVFLGRWTAFARAVTPALAGVARMPYRRFLAYNAVGGIAWGATFVLLGYLAGNSYATVEKVAGRWIAGVIAVLVIGGLIAWRVRRSVLERRAEDEPAGA
jgi:membrane-associated protein